MIFKSFKVKIGKVFNSKGEEKRIEDEGKDERIEEKVGEVFYDWDKDIKNKKRKKIVNIL